MSFHARRSNPVEPGNFAGPHERPVLMDPKLEANKTLVRNFIEQVKNERRLDKLCARLRLEHREQCRSIHDPAASLGNHVGSDRPVLLLERHESHGMDGITGGAGELHGYVRRRPVSRRPALLTTKLMIV